MVLGLRPTEWVPVVTTVGLFAILVFGVDALASRAWADLVGLFYLAATPFVYAWLKSIVPRELGWSDLPGDLRQLVGLRVD